MIVCSQYCDVYSPMTADNTVKRNRMDRRQTDLLQVLLWKDNLTKVITIQTVAKIAPQQHKATSTLPVQYKWTNSREWVSNAQHICKIEFCDFKNTFKKVVKENNIRNSHRCYRVIKQSNNVFLVLKQQTIDRKDTGSLYASGLPCMLYQ